jgi:small subunit ribosomal protein S20
MANHHSSVKRNRQNETRRIQNRYYSVSVRNAVRKIRAMKDKKEAIEFYPKVVSMLDKLAKRNVIHKNNADNLKSKLAKFINKLS